MFGLANKLPIIKANSNLEVHNYSMMDIATIATIITIITIIIHFIQTSRH